MLLACVHLPEVADFSGEGVHLADTAANRAVPEADKPPRLRGERRDAEAAAGADKRAGRPGAARPGAAHVLRPRPAEVRVQAAPSEPKAPADKVQLLRQTRPAQAVPHQPRRSRHMRIPLRTHHREPDNAIRRNERMRAAAQFPVLLSEQKTGLWI